MLVATSTCEEEIGGIVKQRKLSSERASQEGHNWTNFSSVALSSDSMVKVVTHVVVLGNVSMAFLHNREAKSHEIWWDCST